MCGINGVFNFSSQQIGNGDKLIEEMNHCVAHRGPDDNGRWSDRAKGVYFGHQRLSIIDLSPAGHQPMVNENGNAIIFNGEVYNYKDLKPLLPDYHFKSGSDTEIMLELYSRKGHESLKHFNGMFAFAFWDNAKEQLMISRDRVGKKPLYYSIVNGVFAFASEIRSLLSLPWIKAEPDDEALYHFLTFNQCIAPTTLFKNIFKLEPGHLLTVSKDGIIQHEQYWDVEYNDAIYQSSFENLEEQLYIQLEKSVNYRMVADVPVGAFLSGGVDSSAIVAMMSKMTSSPIKTYSIGFEGQPDYDELLYARKISKRFNTEHFEKVVKPDDLVEFLPHIANIFDEPLADSTSIPIYFISQIARQQGTIVVQTGDGSDEIFGGYRAWLRYKKLYPWYHIYNSLPVFIKKGVASSVAKTDDGSPKAEMLNRAAMNQEFFWGGAKAFRESTKRNFLEPAWSKKMEGVNSYNVIRSVKEKFYNHKTKHKWLDDIDWMCYLGFKQQIPNRYLHRMDRLGMAHSIEIRCPFLDFNLVNFALSIPSKYKLQNETPKYILKKSLERILDKETLYRKKMGFCVPLREWAGEIMIDYVEKNLKSFSANTGIFSEQGLRKHIQEIKSGNQNYTNNLWTIYFLMAWWEKWMR